MQTAWCAQNILSYSRKKTQFFREDTVSLFPHMAATMQTQNGFALGRQVGLLMGQHTENRQN